MMYEQTCVEDFHREFNLSIKTIPCIPEQKEIDLAMKLIKEEVKELEDGFVEKDVVEVADGLGDIIYVVLGAAIRCGIDLEPVFREIHRSNMTKKGGYKAEDGKWIKPSTYEKPKLLSVLIAQGYKGRGMAT